MPEEMPSTCFMMIFLTDRKCQPFILQNKGFSSETHGENKNFLILLMTKFIKHLRP